ncbi:MAG: GH3 auxin-responsive promoter family protein [Planctomycetota bacterium]
MALAEAPIRWTAAVGFALQARVMLRAQRLANHDHWQRETKRIQLGQLRKLLRAARQTEFGREHGFDRISRLQGDEMLAAYRAAVPIADWYAFQDRIARMREGGEPDLLWPGLVGDFAQTSGTTAGDKFIPVSKPMFRSNYLTSLDIFAHLINRGFALPDVMGGRALFLGGSTELETNEHGINTGDLSGLVTPLIRWPLTEVYTPGAEIALESHWPTKIEKMARLVIDQDVRFISGMPSWACVLFERVLELARERGAPARVMRDVWPHLRVFVHGGVNYLPFLPKAGALWDGDATTDLPARHELYPASEGFIAQQDGNWSERGRNPPLRLCVDNFLFHEFVPLEEIGKDDARAFAAWEVEPGVRYVVVPSTCAGLWRYVLGDVVVFDTVPDGVHRGTGPARVRIVGRHKHFINAFGENLIVEHIERAVADASRAVGIEVGEFTAAPVYPADGRRAGLELAIEVAGALDAETFSEAFDASLKEQNVDYTTKRSDGVGMGPPTITRLDPGAFHRWLDAKGKLGGQHKCPRCANHREIMDELVASGA